MVDNESCFIPRSRENIKLEKKQSRGRGNNIFLSDVHCSMACVRRNMDCKARRDSKYWVYGTCSVLEAPEKSEFNQC